jgi:hypothetical protein
MWQHELPNGETVSLIVYEQPMTQANRSQLASAKQAIFQDQNKANRGHAFSTVREPRGFLQGRADDGTRFLIDISTDFLFK